jgi:hypothetical protein
VGPLINGQFRPEPAPRDIFFPELGDEQVQAIKTSFFQREFEKFTSNYGEVKFTIDSFYHPYTNAAHSSLIFGYFKGSPNSYVTIKMPQELSRFLPPEIRDTLRTHRVKNLEIFFTQQEYEHLGEMFIRPTPDMRMTWFWSVVVDPLTKKAAVTLHALSIAAPRQERDAVNVWYIDDAAKLLNIADNDHMTLAAFLEHAKIKPHFGPLRAFFGLEE